MTNQNWLQNLTSALDSRLGFELLSVSPKGVRGRYPMAGNTQPAGLWHGGASAVAVETLGSLAALAEVGPSGKVLGLDLNVTHLNPGRVDPEQDRWVTGEATPLRVGGTVATYSVQLWDDDQVLLAVGRITLRLIRSTD